MHTGAHCTYEEQCISIPDSQQEVSVTCCDNTGVGSRPQCVSRVESKQAMKFCEGQGLRLCTEIEIKSGSGEGTGCEFDSKLVWTSTPCDVTGKNILNHRLRNLASQNPIFSLHSFNSNIFLIQKAAVNGTSYSLDIPRRPLGGCSANTYGCSGNDCNRPQSCFCEEHCSWETCRLVDSPGRCLKHVESTWIWDAKKHFWVAQLGGMIYKLYSFIHLGYNNSI